MVDDIIPGVVIFCAGVISALIGASSESDGAKTFFGLLGTTLALVGAVMVYSVIHK